MCAMKEVTLFSDDAKSKESAQWAKDIKGANILVDPNGDVKLADFGMAKHILGQSCPLSFKGALLGWHRGHKELKWCNLAVDLWSLGCSV
ncbi:hypothetical protein AAG906_034109 [Vitis piasezkii]